MAQVCYRRTSSNPNNALSRSSTISDGDASNIHPMSISQLYSEAAEFEKILASSGCIDCRRSDVDGANGFADLIGRDLSPSEKAVACRAAKLSVTGYTWTPRYIASESESYDDDLPPSKSLVEETEADIPTIRRASTMEADSDSWKLEPGEIIQLLIHEFGSLATQGEEEKLILETDGCLIHDVIIVGVVHLTTHRLTFHASLLAARPDLPPSQQIIKAGPVILHRRGWRAKRRAWVELSHDMMCTYASSSDEGRTRPLCTVLLAFIVEILPIDASRPRHIRIVLNSAARTVHDSAEFDTEESAQDWRKELTGALFLYRHRRRETLDLSSQDEAGVRLSCPLDRIEHCQFGTFAGFPSIVSLRAQFNQSIGGDGDESENTGMQTFQIGPILPVPVWGFLNQYIAAAKRRVRSAAAVQSPILVDFGPLNFSPSETKINNNIGDKEKIIREVLALGTETQLWTVRARLAGSIASYGYFAITPNYVGFWSKNLTQCDTRYRIATPSIKRARPFNWTLRYINGMALEVEGNADLKLAFRSQTLRDEVIERVNAVISAPHVASPPTVSLLTSGAPSPPKRSATGILAPLSRSLAAAVAIGLPSAVQLKMPKVINLPREILPSRPALHFICLTIGSRGDVQPYIALGLGLKKEGHRVTIVTHEEYRDWITGFGIEHRQAGGDPGALMKLSVDNKMFSPEFFRQSLTNFRPWLDQLLLDAWEMCKDADVLLESPSAMAGVHIAEALNIPYFRTFTMPWTKTSEFPHAFLSPPVESPTFNSASYVLFSNVLWTATSTQINRWRRQTLKLGSTDMGHLAQSKITFIYNFSQAVVPKPLDWGDTNIISGYWFLDDPDLDWKPPEDLLHWMAQAREDKKPIVYIGFGSITVPRPNRVTARIVKAVVQSDVRAIISKGWSARMSKPNDKDPEVEVPPQCYMLDKVPHDWLFPQIDAALHHGGAGTTGASLRAGIPTLIKPWFGDQFFWASRVQKLGAGLRVPSLHVNDLADALRKATTSNSMKKKAASVGEKIRAEDGVHTAIHTIYTYLPRASQDRALLDK